MKRSIITRTGSYIPPERVPNTRFLDREFFDPQGRRLLRPNPEIIKKLYEITGIEERRYAPAGICTTDMAARAAEAALEGVDREGIDYIIVAHNFGDLTAEGLRSDMVPTIASRVKHRLKIKNPYTVAFDLPFGCPGWLQGMIMADYFIRSGDARRALVIGAENLARIADPHDMDSMIYSDGAGATLVEATDREEGILAHLTRTDAHDHAFLLRMGTSYNPGRSGGEIYVKMDGHDIYKYAVKTVPLVVKKNLEAAGLGLGDVAKILIHQANEKMDAAIVKRLFDLYKVKTVPPDIMPMIISWTGNSSVATLPTLLDLITKERLDGHRIRPGDILVFASVGAGMNVNSMVYKVPAPPAR
ncbi:MAG: ketoacyl-ACP synthase III [Desulfobacterales bacterium]|nr:ketoacyl-ACP synthase III [Desulfobacterales bacterium]